MFPVSGASSLPEQQLSTILNVHGRDRSQLIPVLQDVQEAVGFVSPETVDRIAEYLDVSPHDVFGVATFFSQFRFQPPGKHCLKVCEGTACHVRGSSVLIDLLTRRLHIRPGETSLDGQFTLERVMCVGSCALAPVVVGDQNVHGRMTQKKLEKLLCVENEGSGNDARRNQAAREG